MSGATGCHHLFQGYDTEHGGAVLARLVEAIDRGESLGEHLAVAREHIAGNPRYVSRCRNGCGAVDVYEMTECGHAPWDRLHGGDDECRTPRVTS